jgi:hypothetical protein
VEDVITANRSSLNGYLYPTKNDGYSLLLMACAASKLDAVQRLLTYGGVDVNQGSQVHGCMGVWVYECMGVWVYGCMSAWMYESMRGVDVNHNSQVLSSTIHQHP